MQEDLQYAGFQNAEKLTEDTFHNQYPEFTVSQGAKVQLGRVLSRWGFLSKELHNGIAYYVIPLAAA